MYKEPRYLMAGDVSLIVEFGDSIEECSNIKVRELSLGISNENIEGVIETIPTYRSLMIVYDPLKIKVQDLIDKLKRIQNNTHKSHMFNARVIEIPTVYGGEFGEDIDFVAHHNKLSVEEVIKIHSSQEYLIYMIGFTPGFPYLGGISSKITTPRLQTPRIKIPQGSVGIAGNQTGIYPIESPGGWQLIGRTPVKLYDPYSHDPVLLKAGDYVKFVPIKEEEYKEIEIKNKKGDYKVVVSYKK